MHLKDLLQHLADTRDFPIKIDDIRSWIINQDIVAGIAFVPVEMETSVMRGLLRMWEGLPPPYGEPLLYADILYPKSADFGRERLACCKEMVHVLDSATQRSATGAEIDKLASELTSLTSGDVNGFCEATLADKRGLPLALVTLVPIKAVNELRQKRIDRAIDDLQIAELFGIPEFYVSYLFTPQFAALASKCLGEDRVVALGAG